MDATNGVPASRHRPQHAAPEPAAVPALVDEPTRLLDFAAGAAVLFAIGVPGVPDFLSVGLVTLVGLLVVAIARRPTRDLRRLGWLPGVLALLLVYLSVVSLAGPDLSISGWPRRALRLAIVIVALVFMVSGRIHLPSVIRGAAAGLVANAALFVVGIAPAGYGSLLSGYLLDKNQAGLSYAVVTVLVLGVTSSPRRRAAMIVVGSSLVWMTGSRTSLAALACGLVWYWLRPRLTVPGRLALAGVAALVLPYLERTYGQVGRFADRAGSDLLRAEIDEAARLKFAASPPQGLGLGEAWVTARADTFFFHNSYFAALVEGGWVYLAVILVLTVGYAIRPLRSGPPPTPLARAAESANIVVLICALSLGEVFFATTAALALAAGLVGYLDGEDARDRPEPVSATFPLTRVSRVSP